MCKIYLLLSGSLIFRLTRLLESKLGYRNIFQRGRRRSRRRRMRRRGRREGEEEEEEEGEKDGEEEEEN